MKKYVIEMQSGSSNYIYNSGIGTVNIKNAKKFSTRQKAQDFLTAELKMDYTRNFNFEIVEVEV
jgi:hypothetical protein